jgi:hypothetical protein
MIENILSKTKSIIADAFPLFICAVFSFAAYSELVAFESKDALPILTLSLLLSVLIWRISIKHDKVILDVPTKAGTVGISYSIVAMIAFFLIVIAAVYFARCEYMTSHLTPNFNNMVYERGTTARVIYK